MGLVDRKITPHVPVWDRSARHDGTFSRADFVFDRQRNVLRRKHEIATVQTTAIEGLINAS